MKKILFFTLCILGINSLQSVFSQELITVGVFGSYEAEFIHGYSIDNRGDLIICGTFQNTVDLNLEEGTEANHTAISKYDIYVAKYDIKGNYLCSRIYRECEA